MFERCPNGKTHRKGCISKNVCHLTETFGEQVKTNTSTVGRVEQCVRQPSPSCLSHIFPFSPSLSLMCFNWTTFFPLTLVHLTDRTDPKSPTPPSANRDAAKRETVAPHSRKWVFYSFKSDWGRPIGDIT